MDVPQREFWDGHPVPLGQGVVLQRRTGERELQAVFRLQAPTRTRDVLEINDLLSRSQVCRSSDEVLEVFGRWRAALEARGWM